MLNFSFPYAFAEEPLIFFLPMEQAFLFLDLCMLAGILVDDKAIRGTICYFVADNLGANQMMGLVMSFVGKLLNAFNR